MGRSGLKLSILIMLLIVSAAPACWGKEKGYCYVVSYSARDKICYFTPVFTAAVSGATYSKEQYVTDVALIRKLEGQFDQYLAHQGLTSSDFVTSARVAYRSQQIAEKYLADEKSLYTTQGYAIKTADDFKF